MSPIKPPTSSQNKEVPSKGTVIIKIPAKEADIPQSLLKIMRASSSPLQGVVENATTLRFPQEQSHITFQNELQFAHDVHVLVELMEEEEAKLLSSPSSSAQLKIQENRLQRPPASLGKEYHQAQGKPSLQEEVPLTAEDKQIDIIPEGTGYKIRIPLASLNIPKDLIKILNTNDTTALWEGDHISFPQLQGQGRVSLPSSLNILQRTLASQGKDLTVNLTKLPHENVSKLTLKFTSNQTDRPSLANENITSSTSKQPSSPLSYNTKNVQQPVPPPQKRSIPLLEGTVLSMPSSPPAPPAQGTAQGTAQPHQDSLALSLYKIFNVATQQKEENASPSSSPSASFKAMMKVSPQTHPRSSFPMDRISNTGSFTGKVMSLSPLAIKSPIGTIELPPHQDLSLLKIGDFLDVTLQKFQLTSDLSLNLETAPSHHLSHKVSSSIKNALLESLPSLISHASSQQITPLLPQVQNKNFAVQLFTMLALARGGNLSRIIPSSLFSQISLDSKNNIEEALGKKEITKDKTGRTWRKMTIPLMAFDTMEDVHIFMPYDNSQENAQDENEYNKKKGSSKRFIIDSHFSQMGHIQIDTLITEEKSELKVILRSQSKLEDEDKIELHKLFETLTKKIKWTGALEYQVTQHFPIIDQNHTIASRY